MGDHLKNRFTSSNIINMREVNETLGNKHTYQIPIIPKHLCARAHTHTQTYGKGWMLHQRGRCNHSSHRKAVTDRSIASDPCTWTGLRCTDARKAASLAVQVLLTSRKVWSDLQALSPPSAWWGQGWRAGWWGQGWWGRGWWEVVEEPGHCTGNQGWRRCRQWRWPFLPCSGIPRWSAGRGSRCSAAGSSPAMLTLADLHSPRSGCRPGPSCGCGTWRSGCWLRCPHRSCRRRGACGSSCQLWEQRPWTAARRCLPGCWLACTGSGQRTCLWCGPQWAGCWGSGQSLQITSIVCESVRTERLNVGGYIRVDVACWVLFIIIISTIIIFLSYHHPNH